MLCDRCVLNTRCERFEPGGACGAEREAYDWLVSQLLEQYELEGLADEILAGRVAMYLIRIARAEAYESAIGVTDKLVLWGRYIRGLDNTLRGVMRDLAVTRAKRKQLEKGEELMVSLDELLRKFVQTSEPKKREPFRVQKQRASRASMSRLWNDWRKESQMLRRDLVTGDIDDEPEEDS
jgi:hypothetical protein